MREGAFITSDGSKFQSLAVRGKKRELYVINWSAGNLKCQLMWVSGDSWCISGTF